ncbi:MAG: gluconolaconase [Proteobacteria bacterium]|nr:gluconolaconase [Pseudomonadota bacterium]
MTLRFRLPRRGLLLLCAAVVAAFSTFIFTRRNEPTSPAAPPPSTPKQPGPTPTTLGWNAHIALVSGDGVDGLRDGPATQARWSDPWGIAIDARGVTYVADAGANNRIRRIAADGTVSPLAGGREGFADGIGTAAAFDAPSGLALDTAGNLYVADTGNHAIRKITPQGAVTTLAGTGTAGWRDGPAVQAQFDAPIGVAVDDAGMVYVADTYNDRIRVIGLDGVVSTLAGGDAPGYGDGVGTQASFDTPCALAIDKAGTLWIADTGNGAIRRIARDGKVDTFARATMLGDKVLLRRPLSLALTHDGYLYVGDMAHGVVLQFAPDARPALLTGASGDGDRFVRPAGLALDAAGALHLSDAASHRLHEIRPLVAALAAQPPAPVGPAPDAPAPDTGGRWPVRPQNVRHEIVGTVGEARGAYHGDALDHLHDGLDIHNNVGAAVLAIADARIEDPLPAWGLGELREGISLDVLSYIHMRVGRNARDEPLDPARFQLLRDETGALERVRVRRGTRIKAGDVLGTTNAMAHVHLTWGNWGHTRNALALGFKDFADHVPPHIDGVQIEDADGKALAQKRRGRLVVPRDARGVAIVVEAWDQVDGNEARRRLGLYSLGYQILDKDGRPAPGYEQPRTTLVFDRIPADSAATKVAYAAKSGITVYGSSATRFRYVVTNRVRDGGFASGSWRTDELPAGDYIVRILASDHAGNTATKNRDVPVALMDPADIAPPKPERKNPRTRKSSR